MNFSLPECIAIASALTAILMAGSNHLVINLILYSLQTLFISIETICIAFVNGEIHLVYVALAIFIIKVCAVPFFLNWILHKINVARDQGLTITAPISMHLSLFLFAVSYFIVNKLPLSPNTERGWPSAMAAISLLFSGLILMLTRKNALSQIIGFLVLENGIYLFAVSQTRGMPLFVEMGILMDVLVGVMITGLLVFRIQKSFEHIDVTQLRNLRD